MKELIENFLKEWENKEGGENSYFDYMYNEETQEEKEFDAELHKIIIENLKNEIKYSFDYIGGFDSPGYDLRCYCLSVIINGELCNYPINFEHF